MNALVHENVGSQTSNLRFEIPDFRTRVVALLFVGGLLLAGCSSALIPPEAPPTRPADQPGSSDAPVDYSVIAQTLGRKGVLHENVYTVTVPRDDLMVSIEGMDVPAAAGIESVFNFYRCSCGKSVVIGQFVCADYEANDVLLALQQNDILVSSVSPYLLYEKPRLLCIRFQSEGEAQKQSTTLKSALSWTARHTDPRRKSDN
jgi:hypothetical protein